MFRATKYVLLIVLCLITSSALKRPPSLIGDGIEYLIQTQSIAFDQSLAIDQTKRTDYWNKTNPYGSKFPEPDLARPARGQLYFGGIYQDNFGDQRYYHFWSYSLVAAPIYLLLHYFTDSEYKALCLLNALCYCLPWLCLIFSRPKVITALVAALIFGFFYPAYIDWQHPELFIYCTTFLAFFLLESEFFLLLTPLLLGVAASQTLPVILFFPLHAILFIQKVKIKSLKTSVATLSYLAGIILALSSLFYFKYYFGVTSVIAAQGFASLEWASWDRVFNLFFSPLMGAFWLLPTLFIFLPLVFERHTSLKWIALIISTLFATWLCTGTSNLSSAQIGPIRYLLWLLAPGQALLLRDLNQVQAKRLGLVSALLLNLASVFYFRSYQPTLGNFTTYGITRINFSPSTPLYRYLHYADDPEILIETVFGKEFRAPWEFNNIYLWNLGRETTLWIIPERALRKLKYFNWPRSDKFDYYSWPANDIFLQDENQIVFNPKNATNFLKHPILGRYLLIWSEGQVSQISTNLKIMAVDLTY